MRYRMRLGALTLGAVSVAALAVGCASNNSGTSTAAPGSTSGDGGNGTQAYLSCLSKNGVTIQQPSARPRPSGSRPAGAFPSGAPRSGGPGGFGGPGGGFPGGGGGGVFEKPANVDDATWQKAQAACASLRPSGRADNGAITAYRNCLSNHGVTASTGAGQFDTTDPKVAAAEKACAALRPSTGPGPTG